MQSLKNANGECTKQRTMTGSELILYALNIKRTFSKHHKILWLVKLKAGGGGAEMALGY